MIQWSVSHYCGSVPILRVQVSPTGILFKGIHGTDATRTFSELLALPDFRKVLEVVKPLMPR